MRILLAEDERDLNRIITKKLTTEGYGVDSCYDGQEALDYIVSSAEYDVVVLDIMMPKLNGLQVLEQMQAHGIKTPVLFLTARDSIDDRVKGLDSGASDYLVKPFSFAELMARLRALARKTFAAANNVICLKDLSIDLSKHQVTRNGQEISLSSKEFAILEYLALNINIVVSREQIENHVWNFDHNSGTNVVDVYIRYLRKKLDDDFETKLIHTVRGTGYVLRADEEQ